MLCSSSSLTTWPLTSRVTSGWALALLGLQFPPGLWVCTACSLRLCWKAVACVEVCLPLRSCTLAPLRPPSLPPAETRLRRQGRGEWVRAAVGGTKQGRHVRQAGGREAPAHTAHWVRRGARAWWAAPKVWAAGALWGALCRPVGYLIIGHTK